MMIEPMLEKVYQEGTQVNQMPSIEEIRSRRLNDLKKLDPGVRRLVNPHIYHVSITETLWNLKKSLTQQYQKSWPVMDGG